MENSAELNILTHIEQKISALGNSTCLLSLNAASLGVAVDLCRSKRWMELLLDEWKECLPLGEAHDLNFTAWGNKVFQMLQEVRRVYSLHHLQVNLYEYESETFLAFEEEQQKVGVYDSDLSVLSMVDGTSVPRILICALRSLSEVLMRISEFLNSPTEELIASSFRKWEENYRKHYQPFCANGYKRWKIQYSKRTLKKYLQEKMAQELENFRSRFFNDDEFDQVFDTEQYSIDIDGLSRFLFTHAERFGVSHIDPSPMFSKELLDLFNFVELWRLMQYDLTPAKKRTEETVPVKDEIEEKVLLLVSKVEEFAVESWSTALPGLWKRIYHKFKDDISKPGPHEKFKEYSKKTVYCIIGHLKRKGVYSSSATNVAMTIRLEGSNNGMRKYVNNGLVELDDELARQLTEFIGAEMQRVA